MLSILGFLVILAPLVIVHEFGHYIFARIFGVKAEIFSVGFGPRIWSRKCGETELRVSCIPLGGYVKLLGEDREAELSPEDQKRALHRQVPWKRFFIFFGGPFFNFIFAIFVFMVILVVGEPQVSSLVGRVVHGSFAEKAGFKSGDEILAIDGQSVRRFDEVLHIINEHPDQSLDFEIKRLHVDHSVHLRATPQSETGFNVYGESTRVGEIDGLSSSARAPQAGVSNPESAAGRSGIKTHDLLEEVAGKPIHSWEDVEDAYAQATPGAMIQIKLKRDQVASIVSILKPLTSESLEKAWGLYSSELFIERTVSGTPAEHAGIQGGDRVIGVGGKDVQSFFELKGGVQKAGEDEGKVTIRWEHNGKIKTETLNPVVTATRDPLLKKTTQYTIGIVPMLSLNEPAFYLERIWNPFTLVHRATERMVTFSWRNMVSVAKMFTGDVSVATLGGPILIGKIAGESLARGFVAFLSMMAILSIGLGVLNLLPVPILDGGHLLLLGIESVRGKPLTMRQMEIVQGVGLSLVLLLMIIVIRNDLTRLPFFN